MDNPTNESRPNPKRYTRRRYRRHYPGLTDEEQANVLREQREAIGKIFGAMEEYFCAEIDAKRLALERSMEEDKEDDEPEVDAEFTEPLQ